ncbi:unnamed protein product [Ectocarpus sp. 12 AP-2014]
MSAFTRFGITTYTGLFQWASGEWVKDVPVPNPGMVWYFFDTPCEITGEKLSTEIFEQKEWKKEKSSSVWWEFESDMLATYSDFDSSSSCFKMEGSLQLDGQGKIVEGAYVCHNPA